ncbi:hypothetical protein BO99DRAFT_54703 [Aspergillus violaceofuscus CBS 115571]|uniref:Uncharacterized protein n=1 Tax=Aspergillus violaceofuscus (strain CBS 115571) TaxID=1450538 RepID=A0A2V5HNI4_ASPV1|nr:hypothetical protein BO99DRAFT_54703 [Aspergillus violaceofuscus CBS 115571]
MGEWGKWVWMDVYHQGMTTVLMVADDDAVRCFPPISLSVSVTVSLCCCCCCSSIDDVRIGLFFFFLLQLISCYLLCLTKKKNPWRCAYGALDRIRLYILIFIGIVSFPSSSSSSSSSAFSSCYSVFCLFLFDIIETVSAHSPLSPFVLLLSQAARRLEFRFQVLKLLWTRFFCRLLCCLPSAQP